MTEDKKFFLSNLAKNVADCLGKPWMVRPPREGFEDENYPTRSLINGEGAEITMRADEYDIKGRASFSGSLCVGDRGQYETVYENGNRVHAPEITVSIARNPEAMAKEIKRRLLPEYLRILALAQAQVKRAQEQRAKRQAALLKLAALTGGKAPDFVKEPDLERIYLPGARHGTFNVHYDGGVSIERLSVSHAEAEHILRYLYRNKNVITE